MTVTLLLMAKAPEVGLVKTRLSPPLTLPAAARLAAAALCDTLDCIELLRRSLDVAPVLALAGHLQNAVDPSLPARLRALAGAGWTVVPQRGRTFTERLVHAHRDVTGRPVMQIGMDTPQLDPRLLGEAIGQLLQPGMQAVLGPAHDGGWWGIGLRDPRDAEALHEVPMSTTRTGQLTLDALRRRGLRPGIAAALTDVDDLPTARAVAAQAPDTAFARALAQEDTTRVAMSAS